MNTESQWAKKFPHLNVIVQKTLLRDGLLEAELHDVMSLDDDVIREVYRYFLPPTPSLIRLPPLFWARLRQDLEDLLEERWTGGVATIAVKNR